MGKEIDYIHVLKALDEIPFGVGKKLLTEFLQGKYENESIKRNNLNTYPSFGALAYAKDELISLIDKLIINNMIKLGSVQGNKFWKVMELTEAGKKEIESPSLYKKRSAFGFKEIKTEITENEKMAFDALHSFLGKYNDFQKKAIISKKSKILCIAGAGSGKTTVLTTRIEFLVKYLSKDPRKILAITFTRKARQEMIKRLNDSQGLSEVEVETFNSFCEKILKKHNNLIYDKHVRVINYKDKIMILRKSLAHNKISINAAIDTYFSWAQRRDKTQDQLLNIFLNDIFYLRDYFKFKNAEIDESSFDMDSEHKASFDIVLKICNYVETYMKNNGLRDFADQLLDTLSLFDKYQEIIPRFDYILIDEYQDVNSTQIRLIDAINPLNLFCVGDPRQSIYGWRGSDIKYIIKFEEKYPDSQIITLTKNYRSTGHIVKLINSSIKSLGLPDIESELKGENNIELLKFGSENEELEFVMQTILKSDILRNEIFVLARTNRQLNNFSQLLKIKRIKHVIKNDEARAGILANKDEITLATIHSIKGMEAQMVFVIGCTAYHFPSKTSEHPVMDIIKDKEYDKEEEERRLFYVAMSRAKHTLYLTHTGKTPTYFITEKMLNMLNQKEVKVEGIEKINSSKSNSLITKLKEWRSEIAKKNNIPAYLIMHDRTLIEISMKNPLDQTELKEVHGLGPNKIQKYGKQLLDIVNGM